MMDKMREEFELWYRNAWGDEPIKSHHFRKDDRGQYFSHHLNECWVTWKASRELLVVELPHMADYVNMLGQVDKYYSYLDDLHAAIHAAGIRTK